MFSFLKKEKFSELLKRHNALQVLIHSLIEQKNEFKKEQKELNLNQQKFNKYLLEKLNEKEKKSLNIEKYEKSSLKRHVALLKTIESMEKEITLLKQELKVKNVETKVEEEKMLFKEEQAKKNYYERDIEKVLSLPVKEQKEMWEVVLSNFENRCVLTGSTEVEMCHFIPLVVGHGGTVKENIFPIDKSLLKNKGTKNPFVWCKEERIDFFKWNELIVYLSSLNGLTPNEFERFSYWCFDNPNDLEDIKGVGMKDSIRRWNVERKKEDTIKKM